MKDFAHVSRLVRSEKGSAMYSFFGFLIIAVVIVGTVFFFPWGSVPQKPTDKDSLAAQKAMSQKDWNTAVDLYTKILEKKKGNADALIGRSAAHIQLGALDKATEDINLAVKANPSNPRALGQRALIEKLGQNYDQAIKDLTKAISLDKRYAWAYAQRADLYSRKDDQKKALADITRALKENGKFIEARRLKGWILSKAGKCKEAAAEFAVVAKVNPKDPLTIQDQAWFLMTCPDEKLRDSAKALDMAKTAFDTSDGTNPVIFETLAEATFRNGDALKASELQKKAVELAAKQCPDGSCTKEMEERLQKYELAGRLEVRKVYEILPLNAAE